MSGYPSRARSYCIVKAEPEKQERTVIHSGISRGMLYLLLDKYIVQFPDSVIQYETEAA